MKISIVLALAILPVAYSQQPAAKQNGTADPKAPGVLEGRVVNAKTGAPLRKVSLTLRPLGAMGMAGGGNAMPSPYTGNTDADGKFRIEGVEPGNYGLSADKQGFVRRNYGTKRTSGPATLITVGPGQELKSLNMDMVPQAVVVGLVLDEDGEPLSRVQVQVMRKEYIRGKQQMLPTGGSSTMDNGEFRMADLPPGRYWISATYRGRMVFNEGPARNTDGKPEEEYVTTYYPASLDRDGAQPIDLEAGQELTGISIRMQKAKVYRVKGTVTGVSAPVRNVRLMLTPRGPNVFMGGMINMGTMAKEDGSFEIGSIQPGAYYVTTMPAQGQFITTGKVAVDVTERNVEGVIVPVGTAVALRGEVRLERDAQQPDETPISLGSVRIQLAVADGVTFNNPWASPKQDGSFAIENIGLDKYRIAVYSLPRGTWLKSIRTEDRDLLENGLDLTGGTAPPVQITLAVGGGQIGGTVQDAKQRPAGGSVVSLIPDPANPNRDDLTKVVTTDQNGSFTMQGIAPGDYLLFAWEDVETGKIMDPEFRKPVESRAKKISIKVNSNEQVTLTHIEAQAVAGK